MPVITQPENLPVFNLGEINYLGRFNSPAMIELQAVRLLQPDITPLKTRIHFMVKILLRAPTNNGKQPFTNHIYSYRWYDFFEFKNRTSKVDFKEKLMESLPYMLFEAINAYQSCGYFYNFTAFPDGEKLADYILNKLEEDGILAFLSENYPRLKEASRPWHDEKAFFVAQQVVNSLPKTAAIKPITYHTTKDLTDLIWGDRCASDLSDPDLIRMTIGQWNYIFNDVFRNPQIETTWNVDTEVCKRLLTQALYEAGLKDQERINLIVGFAVKEIFTPKPVISKNQLLKD